METIGQVIKSLRKEKKLTLSQIADPISGYDAGNLSRLERNKQNVSHDILVQICEGLGVKVSEVYARTEGKITSNRDAMQDYAVYNDNDDHEALQAIAENLGIAGHDSNKVARINSIIKKLAAMDDSAFDTMEMLTNQLSRDVK